MDVSEIDIDNFDWEQNHNYAIVNGVLLDRNLMGNRIQGLTAYALARNGTRYGHSICPVCHVAYSNYGAKNSGNHDRSKRHKDALEGKIVIQKPRKVY